MLTGLFFLGGLIAFIYICWWTYLNDRPGANSTPVLGLLAMTSPADEAEDAEAGKTPAWKRQRSTNSARARRKWQRNGR